MNDENKDLWYEIPAYAWIALARRGMEKISLDQCFLPGCDNQDKNKLIPLDIEEFDDDEKNTKLILMECEVCGGKFKLKLETLKKVAKPTKKNLGGKNDEEEDQGTLSMGLVYALDENGKNLGHIGYF